MVPSLALARSFAYHLDDDLSEPVMRIMSVPAMAARMARRLTVRPRACAVPLRESVMVTPVNPSPVRSSRTEIAWDQPAAFRRS
jgi:hypothetical protein